MSVLKSKGDQRSYISRKFQRIQQERQRRDLNKTLNSQLIHPVEPKYMAKYETSLDTIKLNQKFEPASFDGKPSIFRDNKGIDASKLSSVPESDVLESRASFVYNTHHNNIASQERPQSQDKINLKWRKGKITIHNQGVGAATSNH